MGSLGCSWMLPGSSWALLDALEHKKYEISSLGSLQYLYCIKLLLTSDENYSFNSLPPPSIHPFPYQALNTKK
jgi:hypothetical protein